MKESEAQRLIEEMGLDPNQKIVTEIRLGDMLMLNELVESARSWQQDSVYYGASDCSATARLASAIDAYLAAEKRAQSNPS